MTNNSNKNISSVSIIIPVYACNDSIEILCFRLDKVISDLTSQFEIILVDDRSPDDPWQTILKLQQSNPHIKAVQLSRNYGQHIAITAGLEIAKGDFAIVMDCDLQDPPEKIPEMFDELSKGYDYVLAKRKTRTHSFFRTSASYLYYKLHSLSENDSFDSEFGAFSLLKRKVINAFLEFREKERHYLFILRWVGFNMGSIEYDHLERPIGESSYTLKKLIQHAIDGIFFQTTVFLKWIVMLGLFSSLSGVILAIYYIIRYFNTGAAEGWTSIVTLILVCTGLILSSIGIVGLYIGKIFDQTKERPLYIINTVSESKADW